MIDVGDSPDLVMDLATRTEAGVKLVQNLSSIKALNVMNRDALSELEDILEDVWTSRTRPSPAHTGRQYIDRSPEMGDKAVPHGPRVLGVAI